MLSDPGIAVSCAPFQNHQSLKSTEPEGWAKFLVFSYSSQRSLANLIPGKKHQSYNVNITLVDQ